MRKDCDKCLQRQENFYNAKMRKMTRDIARLLSLYFRGEISKRVLRQSLWEFDIRMDFIKKKV